MARPHVRIFIVIALLILFSAAQPAARASVAVTAWDLETLAYQSNNTPIVQNAPAMPFLQTDTDTDGGTTAVSNYNFSDAAGTTTFHFDFDHDRSGVPGALASGTGMLSFDSSSGPLKYTFGGAYDMSGTGYLSLEVELVDTTLNLSLFHNLQESHDTPDESFVLGNPGGDAATALTGQLAGALTMGHSFLLTYSYVLSHPMGDGSNASSHGVLQLDLQTIPEPGTWLLLLGGSVIARRGIRRRESLKH